MTPDVAVVIPLKLVYTPVDATVTAIRNYQVPSTKPPAAVQEQAVLRLGAESLNLSLNTQTQNTTTACSIQLHPPPPTFAGSVYILDPQAYRFWIPK